MANHARAGAGSRQAPDATDSAAVQRVVDDYIGLYTKERLAEWKTLFLPGFTATYTNADGTVTTRTLEEFYESQRAGFARAPMTETLHDVRITRDGRLAHVFAGFDFTTGGKHPARPSDAVAGRITRAVPNRLADLHLPPAVGVSG